MTDALVLAALIIGPIGTVAFVAWFDFWYHR